MNTVADFLNKSYRTNPDKIAIIDNDSKLTYSELHEEVNNFSSFLNKFPKNSVVSLLFDNTREFVISYLGTINSGCIAHLIPIWDFSKKSYRADLFGKTKISIIFGKLFFQDSRSRVEKYREIKILGS